MCLTRGSMALGRSFAGCGRYPDTGEVRLKLFKASPCDGLCHKGTLEKKKHSGPLEGSLKGPLTGAFHASRPFLETLD